MFTLYPNPDMWTAPEGARLLETHGTFKLDATLELKCATYALEEHVVEPGLLLNVREEFTVLESALPKCVVGLERSPGGRRPTVLEGLVENGGHFHSVSAATAWEWRRSIRDPASLRNFTNDPRPLQGAALMEALRKVLRDGFTPDEVSAFVGDEHRAMLRAEALAAARVTLDAMPVGQRAAWLHGVATAETVPGFGIPHLGGGTEAYLDALGRYLEATKAPLEAILAAADVK